MDAKRPSRENPYHWTSREPGLEIVHPHCAPIVERLCRGELIEVIGGHGMGKTVLLSQIATQCREREAEVVLFLDKPDMDVSLDQPTGIFASSGSSMASEGARGYVQALATRLGRDDPSRLWSARDLVGTWMRHHRDRTLIVLLDEIDRLVETGSTSARDFLDALVTAHSEFPHRFSVAIAGGLGIHALRSDLGSDFSSRASTECMQTFGPEQLDELAGPFARDGRPLEEETLETLRLLSGGIPALVAYGMQHLWDREAEPSPDAIRQIFEQFRDRHKNFRASLYRGLDLDDVEILEDPFEQLRSDLRRQLGSMGRMAGSFFQGRPRPTQLVQEATISAALAIGLKEAGWRVEREPMRGPGLPTWPCPICGSRIVRMRSSRSRSGRATTTRMFIPR